MGWNDRGDPQRRLLPIRSFSRVFCGGAYRCSDVRRSAKAKDGKAPAHLFGAELDKASGIDKPANLRTLASDPA